MCAEVRGQIIHGECLGFIRDEIEANSIDMILTDPPYNLTDNHWDKEIPLNEMWNQFRRVLKPRGIIAITASQPFSSRVVLSNLEWFRHEWVWIKNRGSNFGNVKQEPMKEHEVVLIFSPGKWTYNPIKQARTGSGESRIKYGFTHRVTSRNYSGGWTEGHQHKSEKLRVPSTWQKFNCEVGLHPNQKPVSLFEYLIRTYTEQGDTILDPYAGSGTTAVSCWRAGRNFIIIEQEEEYYLTLIKRLRELSLSHNTKYQEL